MEPTNNFMRRLRELDNKSHVSINDICLYGHHVSRSSCTFYILDVTYKLAMPSNFVKVS